MPLSEISDTRTHGMTPRGNKFIGYFDHIWLQWRVELYWPSPKGEMMWATEVPREDFEPAPDVIGGLSAIAVQAEDELIEAGRIIGLGAPNLP